MRSKKTESNDNKKTQNEIVETEHAPSLRHIPFIALVVFCTVLNAQNKIISLSAKVQPIKEVFAQIQQKSGYRILYNDEVVKDELRVSVDAEKVTVKQLLETILPNSGLTFVLQSDNLIVIKKETAEKFSN